MKTLISILSILLLWGCSNKIAPSFEEKTFSYNVITMEEESEFIRNALIDQAKARFAKQSRYPLCPSSSNNICITVRYADNAFQTEYIDFNETVGLVSNPILIEKESTARSVRITVMPPKGDIVAKNNNVLDDITQLHRQRPKRLP